MANERLKTEGNVYENSEDESHIVFEFRDEQSES